MSFDPLFLHTTSQKDFPGHWLMPYAPRPDEPQTPCYPERDWPAYYASVAAGEEIDREYWPDCHDFHCSNCGQGTEPGPGTGSELRETWVPDASYSSSREYPSVDPKLDIWGPLGDGYEMCADCNALLEGVL